MLDGKQMAHRLMTKCQQTAPSTGEFGQQGCLVPEKLPVFYLGRLPSLFRRLRGWSTEDKVRWFGAENPRQAVSALVCRAKSASTGGGEILVVGDGGEFQRALVSSLARNNLKFREADLDALDSTVECASICLVLCAALSARYQTLVARRVSEHVELAGCPFESVTGLDASRNLFKSLDEYHGVDFVSPVLLDSPSPYEIYEESLKYFEQKCGLRDYLDLYQLLKTVVENSIEGDIAEFGSFHGHSGWLIATTLRALGSDKKVYMFDTFESFPVESVGVDYFWSQTHAVDFASVKARFEGFNNVVLVKGDFTETFERSDVAKLALAYIDCDSYRATKYLLEKLPNQYLGRGAVLVCEDYGHPALLGNRAAVHQVCDELDGWFRFYSQFSGYYIMTNLGGQHFDHSVEGKA